MFHRIVLSATHGTCDVPSWHTRHMTLDDLLDDYASLPARLDAVRARTEARVAEAAKTYQVQEIADKLKITRQQVTRIVKRARARQG